MVEFIVVYVAVNVVWEYMHGLNTSMFSFIPSKINKLVVLFLF